MRNVDQSVDPKFPRRRTTDDDVPPDPKAATTFAKVAGGEPNVRELGKVL